MRPSLRRFALPLAALALAGCSAAPSGTQAWQALPIGTDAEFRDVYFADSLRGWMVGGGYDIEGGLVARTTDGGRTWAFQSGLLTPERAFRAGLNAVTFLSEQRGFVITDGGRIFATDDGGDNWRLVRYGRGPTDHLFGICFTDTSNGWVTGLGGVLRTRDGGEHWETVLRSSDENGYLWGNAIQFHDAWRGVMVGHAGGVWRSADGGATWVPAVTPLGGDDRPNLSALCFVDEQHGWAVGEEGTMLATTDGGASWFRQESGVPNASSEPKLERIAHPSGALLVDTGGRTPGLYLSAVRFTDREHGWAAGFFTHIGRSLLLQTADGGSTWRVEALVEGEELRALCLLSPERGWAVGDRVREGRQVLLRRTPARARS